MPKYRVKISEVVTYNIEVEADNEEAAGVVATEVFLQAENTDQYFSDVVDREVEGVWEL